MKIEFYTSPFRNKCYIINIPWVEKYEWNKMPTDEKELLIKVEFFNQHCHHYTINHYTIKEE